MTSQVPTVDRTTLLAFGGVVLFGGLNALAVKASNAELAPYWGAAVRFGVFLGSSRLAESLAIIRRLWTGERVVHRGRFWTLDDVFIAPAPRSAAGPPVWNGAKVDAAIRRAAVLGDGWFASANDGLAALRRQIAVYREAAAQGGQAPG